ncbi:MAG TPA: c-type cytochrome domain-containing protein [Verrucomicrobiae bacterium]
MKGHARIAVTLRQASLCLLALCWCGRVRAAETDATNLPPPAAMTVDFARDIKPILADSCLRCHGPQKPKSGFRLDNLPDAIKGGDNNTNDIVPGDSAASLLIPYVARQVPDMEMPPAGKGDPLTTNQIALLRAWIDQGASWSTELVTNDFDFSFTPILGANVVSGNAAAFREQYWQRDGAYGGVEKFQLFQQTGPNTTLLVNGHVLPDDYKITGTLNRNDLGFIDAGWQQFRKYYDDVGGYNPNVAPMAQSLNEDLHLDNGKAWVDFGLTLPDWPQMVLGYEYDYRQGNEALTQWGAVTGPTTTENIAPAYENVHEGVHILKFDLTDDIAGYNIADSFRGEFYNLKTGVTNTQSGPDTHDVNQGTSYFQGANTIRVDKKFNDWFYASAGYLYSKLDANSFFVMDDPTLQQVTSIPQITLEKESHVGNINGQFGPFGGLTIATGAQAEWTRQNGFGMGTWDQQFTPPPDFIIPFTEDSDYDEESLQENLSLRYTSIPYTTLYLEGNGEEQDIGQDDQFAAQTGIPNKPVFQQHTAFSNQSADLRIGMSSSPWRFASFSAQYRRLEDYSHYDNDPLIQPLPTAYPAFIHSRWLTTDEVETKMILYLDPRIKAILSYQYQDDGYDVNTQPYAPFGTVITPGGNVFAGRDYDHIFSIGTTFLPTSRLYLSTTFTYELSAARTMANGTPAVAPYRGNIYTALVDGTYVLSQNTDIFAGYYLSDANYAQNNYATGQPLGIEYQQQSAQIGVSRRLGKNASARLQYRYTYYNEPTSGGANNYRASSIFGSITFQLP